jgi:ABC-type Mn2+/Zn2+ transport system permease subunit
MFPGLVIAVVAGLPLLGGGAIGLAVAAVAIGIAGSIPGIGRDTAVGVTVTGLFGVGALLALSPASPPGIQSLLFGDVLGVTGGDLVVAASLAAALGVAMRLLHPRLLAVAFDRSSARSVGASPASADLALLGLVAAAVLIAVQAVGNLLVVAVLVAPALSARRLCRRLGTMMIVAAGLAVGSGFGGLYASYYLGTAAGASIAMTLVLTSLLAFVATWLVAALRNRGPGPASRSQADPDWAGA